LLPELLRLRRLLGLLDVVGRGLLRLALVLERRLSVVRLVQAAPLELTTKAGPETGLLLVGVGFLVLRHGSARGAASPQSPIGLARPGANPLKEGIPRGPRKWGHPCSDELQPSLRRPRSRLPERPSRSPTPRSPACRSR